MITTPEEQASTSFLSWDDASLGRAIKAGMFHIDEDAKGSNRLCSMSAMMILVSLAHKSNASTLTMSCEGVTHNGEPDGDWSLVLRKTTAPKLFEQITAADLKVGDIIARNERGETDTILELDVLEDGDVSILYKGTVDRMKAMRGDRFNKRDAWWGPICADDLLLREVKL